MVWIIAWKNIWRNKVRSLVIILAISLGLLGGIFSSAVMKGMGDQHVKEAVSRETSHLQIHNQKYLEDNETRFIIANQEAIRLTAILDTFPGISGWSSRIKFMAMANGTNGSTGVTIFGVNPDREKKVSGIPSTICDSCGSYFDGNRKELAVVGEAFVKKLQIRLHSKFVVTFQDMNGTLTGAAFRVGGIYRTSNTSFDETNIFVNKDYVAKLLAIQDDGFHELAIKLSDLKNVSSIQEKLSKLFPDLSVQNWKQIDPTLGLLTDLMNTWLYLFMIIILTGLTFGLINTMLMVILERTRELGMLTAIGMNKQKVFLMIMLESVYLSFTGGVIGMSLSLGLIIITAHTGINLSRLAIGFEKIGYNPVLYPALDPIFFLILTLMVIIVGILASVYPALKVLKQPPAEAVRNE